MGKVIKFVRTQPIRSKVPSNIKTQVVNVTKYLNNKERIKEFLNLYNKGQGISNKELMKLFPGLFTGDN